MQFGLFWPEGYELGLLELKTFYPAIQTTSAKIQKSRAFLSFALYNLMFMEFVLEFNYAIKSKLRKTHIKQLHAICTRDNLHVRHTFY